MIERGARSLFNVELLPAKEGDCILVEYGPPDRPHRILIDGGRKSTVSSVRERLAPDNAVDLFVISHIDLDHIEGAVELLEGNPNLAIGEVWFNAYRHVSGSRNERGARDGEALSRLLGDKKIAWNEAFGGDAVAISGDGSLPLVPMPGGLMITVLSPTQAKLRRLEARWVAECERAGIVAGKGNERSGRAARRLRCEQIDIEALASAPFFPDDSRPNGTSIALLAEFEGRRALLAADAHEDTLVSSLQRLRNGGPPFRLDLLKVPHHGSAGNLSNRLMAEIDCPRYAISSDGSRHGLPDPDSIARIVKACTSPCELYFNYRSPFTLIWEMLSAKSKLPFSVIFGNDGHLKIKLLAGGNDPSSTYAKSAKTRG
ncbi:beta-lactamase superfamily II metal-dependent hydrolase [Bradyrhizobium sp. GM6.1]